MGTQHRQRKLIMKKIRRAEFFLAVAIVTSAAVMQIREYVLNTAPPHDSAQTLSCDAAHPGLSPASCAAMRSERPGDGATHPQQSAPRIWV
jgi:hypothetical protein